MIFDTYSRRKKMQSQAGQPDVYRYDIAPEHLRYQIYMVFTQAIGQFQNGMQVSYQRSPAANVWWNDMHKICSKELFSYIKTQKSLEDYDDTSRRFVNYLMSVQDIDDFLSAVELGCVVLTFVDNDCNIPADRGAEQTGKDGIEEINIRFRQHDVGYQFENRSIIRIDSHLVHSEIVKPALVLLSASYLKKANDDFMTAHRHYRSGEYKDCVTAANRAFESTLKAICDTQNWEYGKGDVAGQLISKVNEKGLFTHDFDRGFASYVAMLKTGLPTVRNDAGGHGEGIKAEAVTAHIARLAINLTASNILFLGECLQTKLSR